MDSISGFWNLGMDLIKFAIAGELLVVSTRSGFWTQNTFALNCCCELLLNKGKWGLFGKAEAYALPSAL